MVLMGEQSPEGWKNWLVTRRSALWILGQWPVCAECQLLVEGFGCTLGSGGCVLEWWNMNEKVVVAFNRVHIQQSFRHTFSDILFILLLSRSLFYRISSPSSPSLHLSLLPSASPPRWQRLSWPPVTQKQARLSWQPPVVHMKWCTFIFRCLPFKTISNGLTGTLVPELQIFLTRWWSEAQHRAHHTDVCSHRVSTRTVNNGLLWILGVFSHYVTHKYAQKPVRF